jgi:hypothetical protein
MNRPTTVKRAYDAAHKSAATPAATGETRVDKLEHEIERHDHRRQCLIASLDGGATGARRRDQGNQGCAKAGWPLSQPAAPRLTVGRFTPIPRAVVAMW